MAQVEINSLFSRRGVPATDIVNFNPQPDGKNYPRARVWEVSGNTYILIVGDVIGTGQNTDGIMIPGVDTGVEDGFYTFVFTSTIGYDPTKTYLARTDGGGTLPNSDRYHTVVITPELSNQTIADAVWDEPTINHLVLGTTGEVLTLIKAAIDNQLQYEKNRTKIDTINNEMIIYENDCTTILRKFKLLDSTGNPSTTNVCERKPISATDGSVCP